MIQYTQFERGNGMVYDNDWPLKYKEAVKFYEKNGHLRVPNTLLKMGLIQVDGYKFKDNFIRRIR